MLPIFQEPAAQRATPDAPPVMVTRSQVVALSVLDAYCSTGWVMSKMSAITPTPSRSIVKP